MCILVISFFRDRTVAWHLWLCEYNFSVKYWLSSRPEWGTMGDAGVSERWPLFWLEARRAWSGRRGLWLSSEVLGYSCLPASFPGRSHHENRQGQSQCSVFHRHHFICRLQHPCTLDTLVFHLYTWGCCGRKQLKERPGCPARLARDPKWVSPGAQLCTTCRGERGGSSKRREVAFTKILRNIENTKCRKLYSKHWDFHINKNLLFVSLVSYFLL